MELVHLIKYRPVTDSNSISAILPIKHFVGIFADKAKLGNILPVMRIRASIIVIAFVITSATWGCVDPLKDDPKYQEMKQLYTTLPIYPDSREGSEFGTSQRSLAIYSRYYAADISYEGLKRFYSENLPASGWEFSKEEEFRMSWFGKKDGKRMNFSRGEYTVSVSYVTKEANAGWDYSLSVEWRSKGGTQQ